ncbi:unnamed protein product [Amoebophrya sp. A25]|nr:unnamed protein product [Amoebophrya sp. A25]|eukprot:GSA25T00008352001.1
MAASPKKARGASRGSSAKRRSSSAAKKADSTTTTTTSKAVATKKSTKAAASGDALDRIIDTVTIPGTFAIIALVCAIGGGIYGIADDLSLHICSFILGMGRGGVPGCATVAGSFFVILAPPGMVNKSLALMTVAESVPNQLVGAAYWRSADWMFALKLNLYTVVGLAAGQYLVQMLSDQFIRQFAGAILLTVVLQMTIEKFTNKGNADGSVDPKRVALLRSPVVMTPLGLFGGLLSYVAGNMGPLLNVYMVFLALPKYEMVGTRAAIFIPIDAIKLGQRWSAGDLDFDTFYLGARLGVIGVMGVIVAKIWLKKASKELFAFVYNRVTYCMTLLSGLLLITGVDLKAVIRHGIALLK